MDVAADFIMDIWVDIVATVGVGTVGIKFTGAVGVGVVSMGWSITLTLYLLLVSTLVLLFFSFILGPGAFLVMGLLFWGGALVISCGWVWGLGLGLGPSYIGFHLLDEGGVGMEPCAPGIALYTL